MPPAAPADPFHAVADATRRAILDRLRAGEASVGALVEALHGAGFTLSRPAVSKHLRVLRAARLVAERRGGEDGRQRVYHLTPAPLAAVAAWTLAYQEYWRERLDTLKRRLEAPHREQRP